VTLPCACSRRVSQPPLAVQGQAVPALHHRAADVDHGAPMRREVLDEVAIVQRARCHPHVVWLRVIDNGQDATTPLAQVPLRMAAESVHDLACLLQPADVVLTARHPRLAS